MSNNIIAIKKQYQFKITSGSPGITRFIQHLSPNLTKMIYSGFDTDENDKIKIDLLAPAVNTSFYYQNIKMCYQIVESKNTHGLQYETTKHVEHYISFHAIDKNEAVKILTNFIQAMDKYTKNKKDEYVSIYMYRANYGWNSVSELPKRNVNTVYLENMKKNNLIEDLKTFYDSADDYHKFGIPYSRKYLFSGPPGVGKTSLIFAIASMMKKEIYMINFNSELDDNELMIAVSTLDEDSVLVLEDIDVLFNESNTSAKSGISFSGMLNMLDGFGRKDRMVVFMTTNHLEKLHDVFIRPGRIDFIMDFTVPSKDQIKEMYCQYFPAQMEYFELFHKKIMNKHPSTSLLQKFFFENRKCPNILEKIAELINLISFYAKKDNNMYS